VKRHRFAPAIVAAAIGVMALAGFGWLVLSRSSASRQIVAGETIYRERCAQCHGANLEGQPDWQRRKPDGRLPAPPHDATGHTWHHSDDQLFAITKYGLVPPIAPEGYQSDMPGFGGVLSYEEIRAVLAYIESRWPPDIRDRQREIGRASRQ
jgi:mono/diheme cytochrome c family protein